VQKTDIKFKH